MDVVRIRNDYGEPVFVVRVDQTEAERLGFDADTVQFLEDPEAMLEIFVYPCEKRAEFAIWRSNELRDFVYEDMDYNYLVQDLLDLGIAISDLFEVIR